MPSYTPTQETFTLRLAYLINERGIDNVANHYGRSRQTVRRWARGVQRPAASTQRSVVRRGRRLTGPSVRTRDPATGRFSFRVSDPRARAMIRTVELTREEQRIANMETATNDRQRDMFASDPVRLTDEERRDIERRFQQLARDDSLGRDTRQKWADLRDDYRKMMGQS